METVIFDLGQYINFEDYKLGNINEKTFDEVKKLVMKKSKELIKKYCKENPNEKEAIDNNYECALKRASAVILQRNINLNSTLSLEKNLYHIPTK